MPGFNRDTTGVTNQNVLYADNVDFSGSTAPSPQVIANGQLLIGSTAAPNIKVGNLTSTGGTITITNGSGTINLETTSAAGIITIDGNTGSVTGSTVTIETNTLGGNQTPNFSGSATTLTLNLLDSLDNLVLGTSADISPLANQNIVIGCGATVSTLSTLFNCSVLGVAASATANFSTSIGHNASSAGGVSVGGSASSSASDNIAIGTSATASASGAVAIGHTTTIAGNGSIGLGNSCNDNSGTNNVVIGNTSAGPSGGYSVCLGNNAGSSNTTGSSNITISNAGVSAEANVIRIGTQGSSSGEQNACYVAGIFNTNSSGFTSPLPVFVDSSTGQLGYGSSGGSGITTIDGDSGSVTGSTVTITGASSAGATVKFVGSGTTLSLDTSDGSGITQRNTFIGLSAGNSSYTGSKNTGVGYNTLHAITSGTFNAAFGGGALTTLTTGTGNMVLGQGALQTANGSYNVGIGYTVGINYTGTESSNILIQNQGVLGENNVIRIGTQGTGSAQQNVCYIAGIFGATTSDVGSTTAVLIDNTGNLGTISSSIRYKENVKPLYNSSSKIYDLSPVSFNYKSDSSKTTQYGLIAEEVEKVFPHLVVHDMEGRPESVKYHELPIFLLAEMKKMKAELDELKRAK